MESLDLISLAALLAREGLLRPLRGSASFHTGDRLLITAGGTDPARLLPTDLVALSLAGEPLAVGSPERPEVWPLHIVAHRARTEARVVVYAAPPNALAVGLLGRPLPALTPDQYRALGLRVPLVRYHAPGSETLAAATIEALARAPAALLQNLGVIVTAESTEQAHRRLTLLEEGCALYLTTLAAGEPRGLSREEGEAL